VSCLLAAIPFPNIDPVLFRVGWLSIRWYGIAYLLGFLAAHIILRRMTRHRILNLTESNLSDLMAWIVAGVLVGGRIGWWLFYHRSAEADEPWYEALAIWRGGMSFHGGLAGVIVALLVWAWRKNASFWNLADCAALVAPIGLFFGRIANFINAELVGRPTAVPWGILFPGDTVARHPSQLYEAMLEGPILLMLLWSARRWLQLRNGQLAAVFMILYGTFRFLVEITREPDPQLGFIAFNWLTMGQMLSALMLTSGVILVCWGRKTPNMPNEAAHVTRTFDDNRKQFEPFH